MGGDSYAFPDIEVDTFLAMPNHIHGVIVIARPNPTATRASPFRWQSAKTSRPPHMVVSRAIVILFFAANLVSWIQDSCWAFFEPTGAN